MAAADEIAGFRPEKDTVLTIGVFDGVHLGHKHLIARLVREARQRGLLAGIITFRSHPLDLLSPGTGLCMLADIDERVRLILNEGVDFVLPLTFTADLARMSARDFVTLLQKHLRMRGLVLGPDFALGRNREGNVERLQELGREMGFMVTAVPPLRLDSRVPSSTAIRQALAEGDVPTANRLAGRPFSLHGTVVRGAGRGTSLGFPTANLNIEPCYALPADGVYASWAHVNGNAYPAMTNVGTCPTFDGCPRTVEVYIIDYSGDLYGKDLRVDFLERVRKEKKFPSVEALKKQMAEDVVKGRAILERPTGNK